MNHLWTFLATSVLVLAAAWVAIHHDATPAKDRTDSTSRQPGARLERATGPAAPAGPQQSSATAAARGQVDARVSDAGHLLRRQVAQAAAQRAPLTQAEMEHCAQLVEQATNHELDRLIPLLDLRPEQQDHVFQALARTSANFLPGMQVIGGGLSPATGSGSSPVSSAGNATASPSVASTPQQQAVLAALTAAQVAAYQQDAADSSAWWSEYLGNAAALLASGTPAVSGSTPGAAVVPPAASAAPATMAAPAISGTE